MYLLQSELGRQHNVMRCQRPRQPSIPALQAFMKRNGILETDFVAGIGALVFPKGAARHFDHDRPERGRRPGDLPVVAG